LRLAVVSPLLDRQLGMKRFIAEILAGLAKHHGHEIHLYSRRFEVCK